MICYQLMLSIKSEFCLFYTNLIHVLRSRDIYFIYFNEHDNYKYKLFLIFYLFF